MACTSADALALYVQAGLQDAERAEVEVHLDECAECRFVVANFAKVEFSTGAAATSSKDEGPSRTIGRYRIDGELGSGAMGVVYAARDPELRRDLAIKVVRSDRSVADAVPRMLREAEAMAAVSHRNVIAVYDVGTTDDGVFIAMERIEDGTLRRWLASAPRSTSEIVRVFLEAGRGLEAAHEARLVHRDFKPDNVLMGRGGRVVVTDFGLVRVDAETTRAFPPRANEPALSVTGGLVGTPAYMAPEQLRGGRGDAHSDQFSFCVALYEALTGTRPFGGLTTAELREAIERGEAQAGPRRIGRRIRAVLKRGLSADPSARFASMGALLSALERTLDNSRWLVAGGAFLVLAAATVAGAGFRDTCVPDRSLWSAADANAIGRVLRASGDYGAEANERVSAGLERFASEWTQTQLALCRSGARPGDPRQLCIDGQRERFTAVVDVLKEPADHLEAEAITAVQRLTDPSRCLEPKPPAPRVADPGVARQLARMRALGDAGRDGALLDASRATLNAAAVAGDAVGEVQARILVARALLRTSDPAAAEPDLEAAYALAIENGDDRNAASAASYLTFLLGVELARTDDGVAWARHAESALARGEDDSLVSATLHQHLGDLYSVGGEEERALTEFEQAVAAYERARASELRLGHSHCAAAFSLANLGRLPEARTRFEKAILMLEDAVGEGHPTLSTCQLNFGAALAMSMDFDAAEAVLERALAGARRSRGDDGPVVARFLESMGMLRLHQGRPQEAVDFFKQALVIDSREKGPEHPSVGGGHSNLSVALDAVGRHVEARASAERALVITSAALGADHPRAAAQMLILGHLAAEAGDLDEARSILERGIASLTAAYGPTHPHVASARAQLGVVLTKSDPEAAILVLQGALDDLREDVGSESSLASAHVEIAEPLLAVGKREEARGHLERASEILTPLLGGDHPSVREVQARLDALER